MEYLTLDGSSPFANWRGQLDAAIRARIDLVIERFADDNLGDHKGVGDGVIETRIDAGPGYRVYYGKDDNAIVILLAGGTKQRQNRDIADAKDRWRDYEVCKKRGG